LGIQSWITARLAAFLSRPVGNYELRGWNDFGALKQQIRKGDVLLVEGEQRVSSVIKYLTHSSWSHAALYLGDELLKRGGEQREWALETFGDEAEHLVLDALFEGVVAAPITKYSAFNVRLCRPNGLRPEHLQIILDDAVASLGWHYDVRNILDLAIHLVMVSLLPSRYGRDTQLGSGANTEVICTSLLGRLFQKVRFPVLPSVTVPDGSHPYREIAGPSPRRSPLTLFRPRRRSPYVGVFRQMHHTLLTPRDFDLSPYFDIIKFNVIAQHNFDYQRMEWADDSSRDSANVDADDLSKAG
jgi:hypothetical protein